MKITSYTKTFSGTQNYSQQKLLELDTYYVAASGRLAFSLVNLQNSHLTNHSGVILTKQSPMYVYFAVSHNILTEKVVKYSLGKAAAGVTELPGSKSCSHQ